MRKKEDFTPKEQAIRDWAEQNLQEDLNDIPEDLPLEAQVIFSKMISRIMAAIGKHFGEEEEHKAFISCVLCDNLGEELLLLFGLGYLYGFVRGRDKGNEPL